jgi:anti-sigma regulatory factor (Ser/Thr protein kinase)/serine/threonine protein phosphatase PrpC
LERRELIRIGQIVTVHDVSEVAASRRIATQRAESMGLSATAAGKAALVATELATNLIKHGSGGSILFGSVHEPRTGLVISAFDRGRGISNIPRAMEDGYSTAGSPGTGLGAIARNASAHDIYTQPDRGTAVLCRIEDETARPKLLQQDPFAIGGVCIPKPGEEQAGDSWVATSGREYTTIAIADGLGHGVFASTASSLAVRIIADQAERTLEQIYQEMHGALRPTRGAAVGIARIHHGQNRLEFAGIGNIAGTITAEESTRRVVSLSGIVGHEMRRVQTFSYPWPEGAVLVLASDGISTSWNPSSHPGLMQRDPALIASVLFRDYTRGSDDSTVVVVKSA